MYNWLVIISPEGVEAQFLLRDESISFKKKAILEKKFKRNIDRRVRIIIVFKYGNDISDYQRNKYIEQETFKLSENFYEKIGSWDTNIYGAYDIRKRFVSQPNIEVISLLDAKNLKEFHEKYSGLDGAIEILHNTIKIMTATESKQDVIKLLDKMIKILNAQL